MTSRYKPFLILISVFAAAFLLTLMFNSNSRSENPPGIRTAGDDRPVCGTVEYMEYMMKQDVEYKKSLDELEKFVSEYIKKHGTGSDNVVITIPTVVHVVWNVNQPVQNISYQQAVSQIRILNEDFRRKNRDTLNTPAPFKPLGADVQIEFCLARRDPSNNPSIGITRTSTTVTEFTTDNSVKFNASGGHDVWDRDKYMNMWVCNLGNNLLGYAQFPNGPAATDGVVIHYRYFGSIGTASPPYHLGRTATHEVGHWLALFHIWGDDNGACWGSDAIDDTPNQGPENYGCPGYPHLDACATSNPGVMFMNYMDYTDDACMNIYTQGQSVRMNTVMSGIRLPLQSSNGCSNVSGTPIAMFTSDSLSIQYGNTVHYQDISGGIPTSWNWSFPGGTPPTSNVQNPNVVYNTPGQYNVSMRVSNSFGSDSVTIVNYIRVRGAAMSTFNLISPPSFTRLQVAANDLTPEHFTWQKSSLNSTVFYKFKIRKIPSGTDYTYLSNNSGSDSVISIRRSFLDSLAVLMGTTGDSVRCTWRVYAYNGIDSLQSSSSFLVTLVRNVIGIHQISSEVPERFALYANYPNPFNPNTKIKFDIPQGLGKNELVKLTIYDILGKQVAVLVNEPLSPGKYSADWDALNFSSGVYFYRLEAGSYADTRKMTMLK
jgi:PKD repeat protein